MKTFLFSIAMLCSSFFCLNAQTKFDVNKLEFGGHLGASFGDYTSINISPKIGYAFTPKLSAGLGVSYSYFDYKSFYRNYAGLNLYAHVKPIQNIILLAEPELLRTWGTGTESQIVPCLLLGGGVILPVGNKSGISMTFAYDVIQDKESPYWGELVYSVGYIFSF